MCVMHMGEKENYMRMFILILIKGKCKRIFHIFWLDTYIAISISLHSSKQDMDALYYM